MDDALPSGWVPLENRLYRHHCLYPTLSWNFTASQLSSSLTAAAPCAGPIALIPDDGWALSFALSIHTQAGHLIARFDRLREKKVPPFRAVALGWGPNDLLTIVYSDGVLIRIPSPARPDHSYEVRVFHPDEDDRVYDAVVLSSADVVLRSAAGRIFRVTANNAVHCNTIIITPPDTQARQIPNGSIAVISPIQSSTDTLETVLLTGNGKVMTSSPTSSFSPDSTDDVAHITISPSGQYLGGMDLTSASVFVYTADLRAEIARVDLVHELSKRGLENRTTDQVFNPRTPETFAWVGNDALAVIYREHLVLVGPHGGVAVLPLDGNYSLGGLILSPECDGLRIVSASCSHFVQMVPEPLNSVLTQRTSPGNKLLRCAPPLSDLRKNHKSSIHTDALTRYRLLRELRESTSFLDATRACVAAAYLEPHSDLQKRLLHAAAYGMRYDTAFATELDPSSVSVDASSDFEGSVAKSVVRPTPAPVQRSRVDLNLVSAAIAVLRVINAVGHAEAGAPLTKPQLDMLGLPALVARLSRFGQHTLAIRVASFGGVPPYDVLAEWAQATILANRKESDEALTMLITERFESINRSYTAVGAYGSRRSRALPFVMAAETAFAIGRTRCAEMLLRREIRPGPKVDMYIRMEREAPAIIAAVSSGDSELVLDVLGRVLERKSVRETARLLKSLPSNIGHRATDLLASHLKQIGDFQALRWVYLENRRFREAALVDIHLILDVDDTQEYVKELEKAAVNVGRGHGRRLCQFEVQALQHAAVVASCSIEVEKKSRLEAGTLRRASDGDLLARAVRGIADKAQRREMLTRLRTELRIPDRRFFWVCLDSMAEVGDFDSIEALSRSPGTGRTPPIGLNAFVDTCIKHKMEDEAVKYALRIADLRDRARALARCGRGREAADIASRLRNQQLLDEVQDLTARHVAYIRLPLNKS